MPRRQTRRPLVHVGLAVMLATPVHGATPPLADDATIVHVLSRLTWGPRTGDVATVRALGLPGWIERQLHPERIEDREIDTRLLRLETIRPTSAQLIEGYDIPPEAKREIQRRRAALDEGATEEQRRTARRELVAKYAPMMEGSPRQVLTELQEAKVLRAILGERQLDEVLVDFWMNHFNVYAQKGPVRFLLGEHERAIRRHAWGRFEDLLLATARSPAMLFYLDNWLSASPPTSAVGRGASAFRRGRFGFGRPGRDAQGRSAEAQGRRRGLNENYARELMELHTLGVDGGHTQRDVTQVARAFTGWTITGLRQGRPEFAFEERLHDDGDRVVLGRRIEGGGEREGRSIIHMLATHASTARFITFKLARRFVADEPPPALVDRAASVFQATDGSIREVVRTIVTSPEFLAPEVRSTKIKSPLEFVVSAVRASGAKVADGRDLARRIADMGTPLYLQAPPTGYKDTAEAWVSTSGLVARLNFALDLAAGRVGGVRVDAERLASGGPGLTDALAARLLPSGLSESTRRTIEGEAAGLETARVAGLILGSPEFQRR